MQPSHYRRPSETPAYIGTSLIGTSLIGTSCDDRNVTRFDVLTSLESPSNYFQIYLDYSLYSYSLNNYLKHRSNIYLDYRSKKIYREHRLIDCLECRLNYYTSLNTVS